MAIRVETNFNQHSQTVTELAERKSSDFLPFLLRPFWRICVIWDGQVRFRWSIGGHGSSLLLLNIHNTSVAAKGFASQVIDS